MPATSLTHPSRLEGAALQQQLNKLPAWHVDASQQCIERHFLFADFNTAFGFMTQVALAAEQRQHHPDWSNVYHRVVIRLTTHEAGGLTERDLDFARWLDRLVPPAPTVA